MATAVSALAAAAAEKRNIKKIGDQNLRLL
jgi:hypothetical protein